jgi:hypothetical protein
MKSQFRTATESYHGVELVNSESEVGSLESNSLEGLEEGIKVDTVGKVEAANLLGAVEVKRLRGGQDDTLNGLERGGKVGHDVAGSRGQVGLTKEAREIREAGYSQRFLFSGSCQVG